MLGADEDRISIAELRNDVDMAVRRARETTRPIVVTENGKPVAMLIDAKQYERDRDTITVLKAIIRGLRSKKTYTLEEVEADLEAILAE